jgi:hypothetical protein
MAPQGTGQETDRKGAKRRDGAQRWIGQREKQLIEDECGGCAVDQEIVPFDRGADDAGHNDALDFGWAGRRAVSGYDEPCIAHDVPCPMEKKN